jgi:hypothetical protein
MEQNATLSHTTHEDTNSKYRYSLKPSFSQLSFQENFVDHRSVLIGSNRYLTA